MRRPLFPRLLLGHLFVAAAGLGAYVVTEQRLRWTATIAFMGVALFAVAAAWVLARAIERPIDLLADAANRVATELAAHVEQLASEKDLREQILTAMEDAVLLGEGGRVVYANPVARRFFAIGERHPVPPILLPAAGEASMSRNLTIHHPDRRELRSLAVRLAGDRVVVVARDVTETARVDRMRRDFVANASHELKTPVAGILATSETLSHAIHENREAAAKFAARLEEESRRLSRLVQDLLDLARLETEPTGEARVSLSEVVEREAERARAAAADKGLALRPEIDGDVEVAGSESDLALAVRNLLDNAIRYTDRGEVSVSLSAADGAARLEIADTGIGIPDRDRARIFERFYRVDKARSRDTGGTGLGLAIVRHVVEGLGGEVRVESELGKGTRFVATLPPASGS